MAKNEKQVRLFANNYIDKENFDKLIEFFEKNEINQENLDRFKDENQIKMNELGVVELEAIMDHYRFEQKFKDALKKILSLLKEYRFVSYFESDEDAEKLRKENDDLIVSIAEAIVDSGIEYTQIQKLGNELKDIANIFDRVNENIISGSSDSIAEIIRHEFGDNVQVKDLVKRAKAIRMKKVSKGGEKSDDDIEE